MNRARPCIFGEVLFDIFPDGNRALGGAPFNLAWHLQAFGQDPCFISRVGNDTEGLSIHSAMNQWGMDKHYLQTDQQRPTGKVKVSVIDGEPDYDIVPDCAYDYISAENLQELQCNFLYHGSLALRNKESADALTYIKQRHRGTVFLDVNLRDPWWDRNAILMMVDDANWVKLNQQELQLLYPGQGSTLERAIEFQKSHKLEGLAVTLGDKGALVIRAGAMPVQVQPSHALEVIDTVGAGDAFAAVLVLGVLNDWPLASTLERAQAFASQVICRQGAIVQDVGFYRPFIEDWDLDI